MIVLATFRIDADAFVLSEPLQLEAIERIEFEGVVPARRSMLPYFWVWGSAFEAAVREEPEIRRLERVTVLEDANLYYAEWERFIPGLLEATRQVGAMVTEGYSTSTEGAAEWRFEVHFPNHADLSELHEYCQEYELDFELDDLQKVNTTAEEMYGLTAKQKETLVAALEKGYFEQPRTYALADLAADFDVTEAAISGRLRRAQKALFETILR